MASIACYVSGHGFGHAARVTEVLQALQRLCPDLVVHLRTAAPRWFFALGLAGPFTHSPCRLDVGAVQTDSLHLDIPATLQAYAEIDARRDELVNAELEAARDTRPALVFADIPALAFDVAARLGVPGLAMSNFSWDWIYADYVTDFPEYGRLIDRIRASYRRADVLFRLPFFGDLSAFPRLRDVPLVARRARLEPSDTRRRLGFPAADPVVLVSFGGLGLFLRHEPELPAGVTAVVTQSGADDGGLPSSLRLIRNAELDAAGVRHEDLVAASDAVLTKPGYGIVAECVANRTAIVYTSRGRFAEYAVLVEGIRNHLSSCFLSNDDLYAGRWREAIESVLGRERPAPGIRIDGAEVVAAEIVRRLES